MLRLIRASVTANQGIYGAPRVFLDLREAGETCSKHQKERITRQIYKTRALAQADVDAYINTFYNQTRHHSYLGGLSPGQFEAAHKPRRQSLH